MASSSSAKQVNSRRTDGRLKLSILSSNIDDGDGGGGDDSSRKRKNHAKKKPKIEIVYGDF